MMERIRSHRANFSAMIKFNQRMVFVGGAVMLATVIIVVMITRSQPTSLTQPSQPKSIQINSANRSIKPQEIWVDRLEKDREFLSKRLDQLEKLVEALIERQESESRHQTSEDRR